jgi:hypothetical protein
MAQPNLKPCATPDFVGVNLRRDTVMIADNELASVSNVDFYSEPGVIRPRRGMSLLLAGVSSVNLLVKALTSYRYSRQSTTVYADNVAVATGITGDYAALVPFRPLNETVTYMFIASGNMKKHASTGTTKWGIAAPTDTPVTAAGAAGSLTGTYSIRYTYARMVGAVVMAESNPSPVSNNTVLAAQVLTLTNLVASTDAQVTHVRVYRTTAGGASYLFDQSIVNGTTTGSSTQVDTALTDLLETDNDPPPVTHWAWEHTERMFLTQDLNNPHYVWFSKRFLPEAVPAANFLEIGNPNDPVMAGVSHAGACGVFTRATKYQIIGNDDSGFVPIESSSRRGTICPNTICVSEYGVVFVARDGVFSTTFASIDTKLSDNIEGIFISQTVNGYAPINWDGAKTFFGQVWKGRYFFSYCSGGNTTPDIVAVYNFMLSHWSFYGIAITALAWEDENDAIIAGQSDGSIIKLETGTTDQSASITMSATTKEYACDEGATVRKLFQYVSVDADTNGETVTVSIYVDDVLRGTCSVSTSKRTSSLFDLQAGAMGFRWRAVITYTGQLTPKVYQIIAYYAPLTPL